MNENAIDPCASTGTAPDGEMAPPAPAAAVISNASGTTGTSGASGSSGSTAANETSTLAFAEMFASV